MFSDCEDFIYVQGLALSNDRSKKDQSYAYTVQYSGMEIESDYPEKIQELKQDDASWWNAGEQLESFCIAGGKDEYFRA